MLFRDSSSLCRAWMDVALHVNGLSRSGDDIRGVTVGLIKLILPNLRNYLTINSNNVLYVDSLPPSWLTKIPRGVPQYAMWRHPILYCDMGGTICDCDPRMPALTYAICGMVLRNFSPIYLLLKATHYRMASEMTQCH